MLIFLDLLFFILHVVVILFNLFGWIWERTRRLHLWVIGITLASWLLLGLKYGIGYCFLTDWHWQVKRKLGEINLPHSFVQYLFEKLDFSIQSTTTESITIISFACAIIASLYYNFFKIGK
jgi:hypothetical protein